MVRERAAAAGWLPLLPLAPRTVPVHLRAYASHIDRGGLTGNGFDQRRAPLDGRRATNAKVAAGADDAEDSQVVATRASEE